MRALEWLREVAEGHLRDHRITGSEDTGPQADDVELEPDNQVRELLSMRGLPDQVGASGG